MPFKYDAAGNIVTADHEGKKLPVFVNAKGEEAPFDADGTISTISRLNGEAAEHRKAKEKLEGTLSALDKRLLEDPASAVKALDIVANLDAKKLVDAGEMERVKIEVAKGFEGKLGEATSTIEALQQELYSEKVGGAFARSKFIAEKCGIPVDFVQSRFEHHFGIEDGKVYAVGADKQKIYSNVNHGQLADFDEALSILVNAHPQKDHILKSAGGSGSGGNGGNGNKGGGGQQGNLAGNRTERQSAVAGMFPDLPRG